ncbi:hypothetical protein PR002_g20694 [Phytophthora rubi]|uniref:Uncharacterized protein n=1 Tax=Phytophthora rubi TaxID=129364 RepID=A0A6A3J9P1_9STRA|nr:hypothetical protein PR002_g20694 [Phytophthora rubi]
MKRAHEASGGALAEAVSDAVWAVLDKTLPKTSKFKTTKQTRQLGVVEDVLRRNLQGDRELANELFFLIQKAYDDISFKKLLKCERKLRDAVREVVLKNDSATTGEDEAMMDFSAAADVKLSGYARTEAVPSAAGGGEGDQPMDEATTAVTSLVEPVSQAVWKIVEPLLPQGTRYAALPVDDEIKAAVRRALIDAKPNADDEAKTRALAVAFDSTYYGTADTEFERHLVRCCKKYTVKPDNYTAPYLAITQSSGFGKSRILSQLARKLEIEPKTDMRLLYICARDVPGSTGFPVATPELFKFIFGSKSASGIAGQLRRAFDYACAHWGSVQKEWNDVFDEKGKDADVQLKSKLKGLKKQKTEPTATMTPAEPVLVLAIDEARSLLKKMDEYGVNYFRLLRRALTQVNAEIRTEVGKKAVIFAVLVDTNSQIHDFVPPLAMDASSRMSELDTKRLFPPFVLTHTMDVFLKFPELQLQAPVPISYKHCVLETNPNEIERQLLRMGRPLWYTQFTKIDRENLRKVLILGGRKLLCGLDPTKEANYASKTLHGVAALMCRLGLRPQSSSAFASQVVANFMAVLHAVNYTHDARISGYVSEPFLTFAATHLWYEFQGLLTQHMLPQLRELLMQGVIDIGSIGEVVARTFLLLAMDAAIMQDRSAGFTIESGEHQFKGQFCAVQELLAELDGTAGSRQSVDLQYVTVVQVPVAASGNTQGNKGNTKSASVSESYPAASSSRQANQPMQQQGTKVKNVTKYDDPTDDQNASFHSWMEKWERWSVGFSHFVELTQVPTEATLWCMLGRRAAGVFPRGQPGADLIIPIFRRDPNEVSYILVQVKNEDSQDKKFPHSALSHMKPSRVFGTRRAEDKQPELSGFPSTDVIRVYIALRQSNLRGAQSYLIDGTGRGDDGAYTLCLRGVCKDSDENAEETQTAEYWRFLRDDIAEELKNLAEAAWWDPMQVIKADLVHHQRHARAVAEELVVDAAKHTLEIMDYDTAPGDEEMKAAPDAAELQQSGDL